MTNDDLHTTRELLSRQLTEATAADPIDAISIITAVQRETDQHLREAVRQAALSSSWRQIAAALGVSKQAAHQRFKVYAKDVTGEIRTQHTAMRKARRDGNLEEAMQAKARRDELASRLRSAAKDLKSQS